MAKQTVTVGCKLPHGLHLDLFVKGVKQRVTVKGNNSSQVVGGFGLTDGVDKEFFEAWLKENSAMDYVQNGLIWAYDSRQGAESKAMEEAEKRHGVEQINPAGDPRMPHGLKTDEEGMKEQR